MVPDLLTCMAEFTHQHRTILDFERAWHGARGHGSKLAAVWGRFNMNWITYEQTVNWIIDQPAALEHDAQTVNRLRRLREQRAEKRTARRDGFDIAS